MGLPAARVSDMHVCVIPTHVGGPVLPSGKLTVLIGGLPAARLGDLCTCIGPPDMIAQGSMSVFIGGMPAARFGDITAHGGRVTGGCPTVLIGGPTFGPGPLSLDQAQTLFDLMAAQPDIAFAYPIDGCYARAHIMV